MNIVLDTNVLVSGLLSPFGPAAEILRLIGQGTICLLYDARIFIEYREVLLRPQFKFDPSKVEILLDYLQSSGKTVFATPFMENLPDPDDKPFLEVALSGHANYLVTFNIRHFPEKVRKEIIISTPPDFLKQIRKELN